MKTILTIAVLIPALAFAGIEDPISTEEFLKMILDFVMSPKGSTLAVVAGVVQLLMAFVVTPYGSVLGKYKLAVLYSLSAILTVIGSLASGMSILEALVSGAFLAALMNAVHQWLKPSPAVVTADLKVKP
jgi:hypothetical protein